MKPSVVGSIGIFEVRHYLNDKIAMFTTIVLPLVLVSVIGMAIGGQPDSFPVGILDADSTPTSEAFVAELSNASLTTTTYTDEKALARDIRLGFLTGGVVIEPGFESALQAPTGQATITLALDAASRHGDADVAGVLGDRRQRRGLVHAGLEVDDVIALHAEASVRPAAALRCCRTSQIASTMA